MINSYELFELIEKNELIYFSVIQCKFVRNMSVFKSTTD